MPTHCRSLANLRAVHTSHDWLGEEQVICINRAMRSPRNKRSKSSHNVVLAGTFATAEESLKSIEVMDIYELHGSSTIPGNSAFTEWLNRSIARTWRFGST